MKRIKRLNEGFAEDVSGGGFNSSNGVFKVSYIPYKDLSKPTGRDALKGITPQQKFQIGDIVSGETMSRKKIQGPIVRLERRSDNKGYNFFVKDTKTNYIYKINPYTIEMVLDTGNQVTRSTINTAVARATTDQMRYQNNPVASGSFESANHKYKSKLFERSSLVDPDFSVVFGEASPMSPQQIVISPRIEGDQISILREEALAIAEKRLASTELVKRPFFEALCELWAIKKLQRMNAELSYKPLIADFSNRHGVSYGEFQDNYLELIEIYL